MRILLHTRAPGEPTWHTDLIELAHAPHVGEYLILRPHGQHTGQYYRVEVVAHHAHPEFHDAEIHAVWCAEPDVLRRRDHGTTP